MIKWENIALLTSIIIISYKILNFGKYSDKIDVLFHYLLINLVFILIYRFYEIIKKEVARNSAKVKTTSKQNASR